MANPAGCQRPWRNWGADKALRLLGPPGEPWPHGVAGGEPPQGSVVPIPASAPVPSSPARLHAVTTHRCLLARGAAQTVCPCMWHTWVGKVLRCSAYCSAFNPLDPEQLTEEVENFFLCWRGGEAETWRGTTACQ